MARKRQSNYAFKVFREDINRMMEQEMKRQKALTKYLFTKKTRMLNKEIGVE